MLRVKNLHVMLFLVLSINFEYLKLLSLLLLLLLLYYYLLSPSILFFAHLICFALFYSIAHVTLYFSFFTYIYIYAPVLCFFYLTFIILHCPLSGPDLIYISLLIIPCRIYYVTNKQTLNLEPITSQISVYWFKNVSIGKVVCIMITHQMHESEQQQTSDFDIMENYNFYVTSPLKYVFQKYLHLTVFTCILFSISHHFYCIVLYKV